MATSKAVLKLAAALAASYLEGYQEWVEACEQDRRDGYRPSSCEHGMNLHVDYDPICGPCEDGITMSDGVFRRQHALDVAKRRNEQMLKIIMAANTLRECRVEVDMQAVYKRITELLEV